MAWLGSLRNGTARLVVEPGLVAIECPGLLGAFSRLRRVEKRYGPILVSHVRLRPPWMSTVVRLDDMASFSVGSIAGKRVSSCLTEAGFEVAEESVWARPGQAPAGQRADRIPR